MEEGQIPQWAGAPQFLESCSVPSDPPSTLPGPQGSGKLVLILSTLRGSLALNEESHLYLSNSSVQTPLALNQRAYRKTSGPRHAHKSPAQEGGVQRDAEKHAAWACGPRGRQGSCWPGRHTTLPRSRFRCTTV